MSPQHPLPSGFGAKTSAREVIGERRLDGTTAIVTGGYAGIGLETTPACEKKAWAECELELDHARDLDLSGENEPSVVEEQKAIAGHLHNGPQFLPHS